MTLDTKEPENSVLTLVNPEVPTTALKIGAIGRYNNVPEYQQGKDGPAGHAR